MAKDEYDKLVTAFQARVAELQKIFNTNDNQWIMLKKPQSY